MAIRNIRVDDDPILRKKSREVTEFNDRLFDLLDDMKETMYHSGGVGLAGPQVGVLKRVVVMDVSEDRNEFIELINPVITYEEGEQTGNEGCLSLPGLYGVVTRPNIVKVKAQNLVPNLALQASCPFVIFRVYRLKSGGVNFFVCREYGFFVAVSLYKEGCVVAARLLLTESHSLGNFIETALYPNNTATRFCSFSGFVKSFER